LVKGDKVIIHGFSWGMTVKMMEIPTEKTDKKSVLHQRFKNLGLQSFCSIFSVTLELTG